MMLVRQLAHLNFGDAASREAHGSPLLLEDDKKESWGRVRGKKEDSK